MYAIKAAVVIFILMFVAAISVYSVEQLIRDTFRAEPVSNFYKNDWSSCDGVYYPESAKQTTFDL